MIPTATELVVAKSEKEQFVQGCLLMSRPHRNNVKYCNCTYKQLYRSNKDMMSAIYYCRIKHPLY